MTPDSPTHNAERRILAAPASTEQLEIPILPPYEASLLEDIITGFPDETLTTEKIKDEIYYLLAVVYLRTADARERLDKISDYLKKHEQNDIMVIYSLFYFLHVLNALARKKEDIFEKDARADSENIREIEALFDTAYEAVCRVLGASALLEHFYALYNSIYCADSAASAE